MPLYPFDMRYVRREDEGHPSLGGTAVYWVEVNQEGHAERQIAFHASGKVVSYDRTHTDDKFGALAVMVIDGDAESWRPYLVSRMEFEAVWRGHLPDNRSVAAVGDEHGRS